MRLGSRGVPLALAVLVALQSGAGDLAGQEEGAPEPVAVGDVSEQGEVPERVGYRRFVFAAVGAAVFAGVAGLATNTVEEGGNCASRECTMSLGGLMGAAIGFLIGNDKDREAAARMGGLSGPPLRFERSVVEVEVIPREVAAFDGGAVVVGQEGIAVAQASTTARTVARELRGVSAAVALPAHDVILVATPEAVLAFPLGAEAKGRTVREAGGTVLRAAGPDAVLLGGAGSLTRLSVRGRGVDVVLSEEASVQTDGAVTDLASSNFAGVVWTLSGDRLIARSGARLEHVGVMALPAPGSSLDVSGSRALIAAGAQGLFLVDVSTPAAPRLASRVEGMRFVYDVLLDGTTAYVAVGREGLLILDLANPSSPRTVGIVRDLGFVADIARAGDGDLYVLDQSGRRLFLLETNRPSGGSNQGR